MFGVIRINRDELKGKDFDIYQHFYCGVCRDLRSLAGQLGRITLTYDMTFLAILLSALYEKEPADEVHRCAFHGGAKRVCSRNEYTAYAADMSVLLVYHNIEDDWIDDHSQKSRIAARLLRGSYLRVAARHPEIVRAIRAYLKALHKTEQEKSTDIDRAAGLTGELMRQVFSVHDDRWSKDLGEIGFYLGKYIYLRDARDDLEEDLKSGSYNPFAQFADDAKREEKMHEILTMMAASASRAFERLPIVEYVDILRNILYSGIWVENRQ